jgi:hypothetical protein
MGTKNTIHNPKEIRRIFSQIRDPTARVKAVVAHVIKDALEAYDVWVGEGYVVIRPVAGGRYIGEVVRQIVWWLKEFGWPTLVRPIEGGYRIEYLPIPVVDYGR